MFQIWDKWGLNQKCVVVILLNLVEQFWKMLPKKSENKVTSANENKSDSFKELMAISQQAINGTEGNSTMRLSGYLSHCEVLLLVDSRSSHSFIREQLAVSISGWIELSNPMRVRVANGNILMCTHELQNLN